MPTTNERIARRQISHAIYIQRYANGEAREMLAFTQRLERRLREEIAKRGALTNYQKRSMDAMLRDVRELNNSIKIATQEEMSRRVSEFAVIEARFQERIMTDELPIRWDFRRPTAPQLRAAALSEPFQGELLREHLNDISANRLRLIDREVRQGFVEGRPVAESVRRIFGAGGTINQTRRQLTALVRTATAHTAHVARQQFYAANDDLVKAERWVSTLDNRTTLTCAIMDGATRKIGEDRWSNGEYGEPGTIHFQCRSTSVSITKSFRELGLDLNEIPPGRRPAVGDMRGDIPDTTDYSQWLQSQSREFVTSALGKGRAELFLDKGVPLSRMMSDLQPLTLKQIMAREGIS